MREGFLEGVRPKGCRVDQRTRVGGGKRDPGLGDNSESLGGGCPAGEQGEEVGAGHHGQTRKGRVSGSGESGPCSVLWGVAGWDLPPDRLPHFPEKRGRDWRQAVRWARLGLQ